ncbi:MAG: sulfotransferase [Pirellulales bacterium]
MNFHGWLRLLARNRFAVHWRCWPAVFFITLFSLFHSVWRRWQWLLVGWRVGRTRIEHEPVFIIGHWRAGTTLLHELLVQDERHTYPTTFECLAPNHFLISEDFATRWLWFLLPSRRPMDNMPAGWQRPQEDEFALANLGVPSPYLTIAFPNHPPMDQEYLTLEGIRPQALERWKRVFRRFLQEITYRRPGRIVLKSPPHTCRIQVLVEMFPGARFVHIVRDPFVVFPSTVNLWTTLYRKHALEQPDFAGLEERVLETFERMYEVFERDRSLVAADRLCEVTYEELVRDPIGQMRRVYNELALGDFDNVLPRLEAYVAATQGYETNRYDLAPELRAEIARRWQPFIRRYGYSDHEDGGRPRTDATDDDSRKGAKAQR